MRKRNDYPAGPSREAICLEQVEKHLAEWRRTHKAPCPLPDEVWCQAAELAAKLGVNTVAKALRLSPTDLRRRTNATIPQSPMPTFVELLAPSGDNIGECTLEIESTRCGRLNVSMKNVAPSGLATLIRDLGCF